jgi:ATP-binding cassette, subfamily C, bacteriocin exporter
MALWAWGYEIDESELRRLTDCTPFGTNAFQLVQAARQLGFTASRKYTLAALHDLAKFTQLHLNPIVYVDLWPLKGGLSGQQHALVVLDIEMKQVVVFDPLQGERKLSHDDFLSIWSEMRFLTIVVDIE